MKQRSLAAIVAVLVAITSFLMAAPVSGHTVTWNPSTYTTPITDYSWQNPSTGYWQRCAPITAWFGEGKHSGGQHYAIDIAVAYGVPVYAPKAGWAYYRWDYSASLGYGGGNMVYVDHAETGGGLTSVVAHLSSVSIPTSGRHWVNKNQMIGRAGNSGNVPTHLHWQMNVTDHVYQNNSAYGANLDWIPGVNGPPTRTVCG